MQGDQRNLGMPIDRISQSILILRGHRVLLDASLAALYKVPTGALVQAVKRNRERFPQDFMFQLTAGEWAALRSQLVISKLGRGGRRTTAFRHTQRRQSQKAQPLFDISMTLPLLRPHLGAWLRSHAHDECITGQVTTRRTPDFRHSEPSRDLARLLH